jgi:Rps23 Pro-64 3,4-dihydroxylase Tpa1-like proline 4-hydroxylase
MQGINLSLASCSHTPFPHIHQDDAIDPELAEGTLAWLETDAPWKLKIAAFYEQFEFSLLDARLPDALAPLTGASTLGHMRDSLEAYLDARLDRAVEVTAHRLVRGQTIRIHNDYIPGRETHRLLIQLNRGWVDENGGALLFFQSEEPSSVSRMFWPTHRSAVGFEISANSHHAVSTIHDGERFTLVYSFFSRTEA